MTRQLKAAALLCAAVLASSCGKDAVQTLATVPPAAQIKFFNFGVNAPGVNFYANDTKMTAITSATGAEATTGVAYGSVGSGGLYETIDGGQYTFTGKIAAATDKDLAIASLAAPITSAKYYSFYQSGFYNTTTKTVDSFILEDALPALDRTVAYVRFVNAISNSSPMTLFAKNATSGVETPLGGPVAYKNGGVFTAIPNGTYDLGARLTGVATNAISRTGVAFAAGNVYTIAGRGDMTVVSTSATNRPFLDNTANR